MAAKVQPRALTRTVLGGVVAGVVGGVALSVFMLVMSLVRGQDAWIGMKLAGMPLIGQSAVQPGFDAGPVLLGVAVHFAVSVFWGVIFALFVYGTTKLSTVGLGAAWGIVVWVGMFFVVLPLAGLNDLARSVPTPIAIIEHVIFGVAVGVGFLPFQRTRAREPRRPVGREPTSL